MLIALLSSTHQLRVLVVEFDNQRVGIEVLTKLSNPSRCLLPQLIQLYLPLSTVADPASFRPELSQFIEARAQGSWKRLERLGLPKHRDIVNANFAESLASYNIEITFGFRPRIPAPELEFGVYGLRPQTT